MKLNVHIRKIEKSDVGACIALFRETVHSVNAQHYTSAQLDAWAPKFIDEEKWWKSLSENIAYLAEYNGQIVGFGDISHQGYFDRLYVHKDFQRKGVAWALMLLHQYSNLIAQITVLM